MAVGACAINGGLPAQRNAPGRRTDPARRLPRHAPGLAAGSASAQRPRTAACHWPVCIRSMRWCTSTIFCPAAPPAPTRSGTCSLHCWKVAHRSTDPSLVRFD
ncbi:MAG: hypothetical protein V9G23_02640 [Giesbergeria sp.]